MMTSGRQRGSLSSGIIITVVIALIVVGAVVWMLMRRPHTGDANDNANQNTNVAEEPTDISLTWPKFVSPYRVTVLMPRGMKPCDEKNNTFTLRTDACTSTTDPSFRFRRNDAWSQLEPNAAFGEAFSQELREAGLESVAGKTTTITGTDVTAIAYTFGEELTGVIVSEKSPVAGTQPRRMSIEVHRRAKPTVDGAVQDVDAVLAGIIQGTRFSTTTTTAPAE